ncbi:MAG: phosphotransferase family protein [Candidatus Sumerlaeaceae bacterium]
MEASKPLAAAPPNEFDARQLIQALLGEPALTLTRFSTGMCHYVYDVVMQNGKRVVARIANPDRSAAIAGAIYWSQKLRPLGVPVADIIAADPQGQITGHAAMILERLPGTDLAHVYAKMDSPAKESLAEEMVRFRHAMDRLPLGGGYGFAYDYEHSWQHSAWADVVRASIDRSRQRIMDVGLVRPYFADLVTSAFTLFESELRLMPPRPFMDDATTKNVIIHENRLSGIVDVDELCFGDPLFNVALTHTSLLAMQADTHYTEHWLKLLGAEAADWPLFRFYVAVFLLDFLSESGLHFNRGTPQFMDDQYRLRLEELLIGMVS